VYLFESAERIRWLYQLHYRVSRSQWRCFRPKPTRSVGDLRPQWGDRMARICGTESRRLHARGGAERAAMARRRAWPSIMEVGSRPAGRESPVLNRFPQRSSGGLRPTCGGSNSFHRPINIDPRTTSRGLGWCHSDGVAAGDARRVAGYLGDLRRDGAAAPLLPRLAATFSRPDGRALVEHMAVWRAGTGRAMQFSNAHRLAAAGTRLAAETRAVVPTAAKRAPWHHSLAACPTFRGDFR